MSRAVIIFAALIAWCDAPRVQAGNDPLGECIADCRKRGAKEATFVAAPWQSQYYAHFHCACTFGLVTDGVVK
jgi:hypothetical protein